MFAQIHGAVPGGRTPGLGNDLLRVCHGHWSVQYPAVASLHEIAPGLRRWTGLHEEWKEQVGAVALDSDDGLVLIDPIEPPRGVRRPEHVLLTVFWHARG